jgi:hypothetical protein
MAQGIRAGVAALLLIGAAHGSAMAVDTKGEFALRGVGGQSCEVVLTGIKADQARASELSIWVAGYVTALNRVSPGTYDLVPLTEMTPLVQIVAGLCAKNPAASVEGVLNTVVARLSVARLLNASPMVEAKADGKTVTVRAATLAAMQAKLIELKLFKGPADGQFGDKTAAALKKYQKSQALAESGLPDVHTVLRMLVEPNAKP